MPRKRLANRVSISDLKEINPGAEAGVTDDDMVCGVLNDFDELAVLPRDARLQLIEDLVEVIRHRRTGVKVGKRGLSDEAIAQQIFLSDTGRALARAGLPVSRWRKRYDRGDGPEDEAPESFYFRFARDLADAFGVTLPKDLKLPAKRAAQHQYGVMPPGMQAAQEAALGAQPKSVMPDGDLVQGGIHQQSVAVKRLTPEQVRQLSPKAIEDRTRAEMEMGKKMIVHHACRKAVPRKPTPSKLRLPLK